MTENELARLAGIAVDEATGGPLVDGGLRHERVRRLRGREPAASGGHRRRRGAGRPAGRGERGHVVAAVRRRLAPARGSGSRRRCAGWPRNSSSAMTPRRRISSRCGWMSTAASRSCGPPSAVGCCARCAWPGRPRPGGCSGRRGRSWRRRSGRRGHHARGCADGNLRLHSRSRGRRVVLAPGRGSAARTRTRDRRAGSAVRRRLGGLA